MRQKIRHLRLVVVRQIQQTTTSNELPSVEDENRLKQMLQADKFVRVIAKAMGKTRDCIRKKIAHLGLEVVEQRKNVCSTTSIVVPEELPSVEEALKILVEAKTPLSVIAKKLGVSEEPGAWKNPE